MVSCTSATCACAAVFNYCYAKHHNPTPPPPQHSDLYLYSYTGFPPSTFIFAIRMVGATKYSRLHHDNVENNAQEMVSHLVVLYCSPCSASRSPPSCHCPLLPITVPSSPSLSPPSHHCPPPSHHCPLRPLLPITVPFVLSFPSLSPPPHHCPLLPITVPSYPSLSPPTHHIMLSWQIVFSHYSQDIPSSPQSSQLKRTPLEC